MHLIEPLETRIAPASFVTYLDVDGDLVKVSSSKGTLDPIHLSFTGLPGEQIASLYLSDSDFQGAALTFTVFAREGGDGQVQVGAIETQGVDLKSVTIKGDLGRIVVGDAALETPGLGLLSVRNFGLLGLDAGGNPKYDHAPSVVTGALGTLKVSGDFSATGLAVEGKIGPVTIGGSFLSGPNVVINATLAARLSATGDIGNVTIGGDLRGGVGEKNGAIEAGGKIGNVKIGRDLLGGAGKQSGYLRAAAMGNVSIGRDLVGGDGVESGRIFSEGSVGHVSIGKDFVGGGGQYSGSIVAKTMGNLTIREDLEGGGGFFSGYVSSKIQNLSIGGNLRGSDGDGSAQVQASISLGKVTIGKNVIGGSGSGSGRFLSFGPMGNVDIAGSVRGEGNQSALIYSIGAMGNVTIGGDLTGGSEASSGGFLAYGAKGKIGNVRIGGSFVGGAGYESGRIFSEGSVGHVSIGKDFVGGGGQYSGSIVADAMGNLTIREDFEGGAGFFAGYVSSKIQNFSVGGNLRGGDGDGSAQVLANVSLGNVTIGKNIVGGSGSGSGRFASFGPMGNVRIAGSVFGDGNQSALIYSIGAMGNVTIGGDLVGGREDSSGGFSAYGAKGKIGNVLIRGSLIGGNASGNVSLFGAGLLFSEGHIASVTIGQSLIAGTDTSSGVIARSGAIVAGSLGPVKIGVGIVGNATNPALIAAEGLAVKPARGFDLAIASLTVAGDVRFAKILAGFDGNQAPANADAAIGGVSVGANWVASSLVAGAQDKGAAGFGSGDTLQTVNNTGLVARIASITIKGVVQGSPGGGDHFGFVAEQIVKLTISGKPVALTAGPANDNPLVSPAPDVRLLEVTVPPF